MNNLHVYTLYSGSGGNAVFISGAGTSILIDAGKSMRALRESLHAIGRSMEEISAVFVTHEHADHVSALEMLAKHHAIPIHMTEQSAARLFSGRNPHVCACAVLHTPLYTWEEGALTVRSFCTPHDSVMSVGYTVTCGDESVGIATDIGHITPEVEHALDGCNYVIVESNHDPDMLKNGAYPDFLKRRILSARGHLSNGDCAALVRRLADRGTSRFLLAHLSAENNLPELALSSSRIALEQAGYRAEDICLCCAPADAPVRLI